ncbi:MAG TPA: hypothetical protein VE777_13870 [Gaiellales bacterium]|jgi:hypothetical protein|nr:hypothetical protein [Gaiellales bacterium]
MTKRIIALAAVLSAIAPTAALAGVWMTVVKKTAHGSATVSFSHSVSHPAALRLKSVATTRAWTHWILSCTSGGGSIKSSSGTWRPSAGTTTKALPMGISSPSSCQVSVSLGQAGLSGTVTVSLQKR